MVSAASGRRPLGQSTLASAPIALGCYSMSNAYGHREDPESLAVIHRALDNGINFIDTADFYGWGHNEQLVASAISGRRSEAIVSTKFGYVKNGDAFSVCGTPEYVQQACDASLRRLGVDQIDIYFQHRVDPNVPIEDTVGAMAELVSAGKVKALGLCEVSPRTLRRACNAYPITAIQCEYSLWTRDVEAELLQECDDLGVALMAFSPLGRGMLTGRIRTLDDLAPGDVRRKYPRFSAENFAWNLSLVDRLGGIAEQHDCTLAQLSLAWLIRKNANVIAICGADTLAFLDENVKALSVTLSDGDIDAVGHLFSPGQVAGDRYNASVMAMLDRT